MTTKTMTFTPHPDLQLLPEADRLKWADALDTSQQYKGQMCNSDNTRHCCLCVAEQVLNGATFEDYKGYPLPDEMENPYRVGLEVKENILLQRVYAAYVTEPGCTTAPAPFPLLNDYYLTHPQIAQLLRGETVTITEEITNGNHWR